MCVCVCVINKGIQTFSSIKLFPLACAIISSHTHQVITGSRAVHGSVRVGFVPNPEPTRRNRVTKKCTRRRPPE